MKDLKHTPAPWIHEGQGIIVAEKRKAVILATVNDMTTSLDSKRESVQNAKLIASAPELLEALIGILNRNDARKANKLIPMDIAIIKAAIKKATE
jgi:hypothetical protein